MKKRDALILDIITEHQRIEVAKLAEMLGVSPVTIRKDLDTLSGRGLVKREHGFAILGSPDDINYRLAYHYDIKRRIAKAASEFVGDGETVMIESGSCCALLADILAAEKHGVTIVTNSAFIAGYVRKHPGAKVILLGGAYQNESQVMVGPLTRKCAEDFFVEKLFIGVDGFSERAGFTSSDYARAETVRDLARQARRVFILTESGKLARQGVVSLMPVEKVSALVTDAKIPAAQEAYLGARGVEIHTVPSKA